MRMILPLQKLFLPSMLSVAPLLALFVTGCEQRPHSRLTFTPAKVVILHAGAPVAGVEVVLDSRQTGMGASGVTDAAGAAALVDVPVGEYKVMVRPASRAVAEQRPGEPAPKPVSSAAGPAIPKKVRSPESTPLTATIQKGKNEITFDLQDHEGK